MSARSFTKEEMEILRENKYTYSISPNTISFTIEFKKEFWKRYQAGERPRDIVEALGYDYQMLGESRISGLQGMIRKQAGKTTSVKASIKAMPSVITRIILLCQMPKNFMQWNMNFTIYAMRWSF